MDSDRRPYGELMTIWSERWESRRKYVGGLYAALGLLCIAVVVLAATSPDMSDEREALFVAGGFCALQVVAGIALMRGARWAAVVLCIFSVFYLLAFPVGTVLGGYTLWVLSNSRDQTGMSKSGQVIATTVGALLVLGGVSKLAQSSSPWDRRLFAAAKAEGGERLYQQWLNTIPDDSAQRADTIRRVELSGLLRLNAQDQLTRFQLAYNFLAHSSAGDCAAMSRATATPDQAEWFLEWLDSASLRLWTAVTARALLAELRHSPAPIVATDSDYKAFGRFVNGSLSAAERVRFVRVAGSLATAPDTDVCWFQLLLLHRALQPDPSRERWVRVLTTLSTQARQ